jgi:cyclic pyranopterin phosphate synthase
VPVRHPGHDLRRLLRGGASDAQIGEAVAGIWHGRSDRYSELRASLPPDPHKAAPRVEMSYIGG